MRNKKGFTFVEVMMIITIIGILAGVVLVNINNSRLKGKDAKIMAMVDSMMTTAQASVSTGGGNYYGFMKAGASEAITSAADCSSLPTTSQSYKAACIEVFNTTTNRETSPCVGTFCRLLIGNQLNVTVADADHKIKGSRFSIVVYLPYAKKIYCKGSNGRSSSITLDNSNLITSDPSCGPNALECPGCPGDLTRNP